RGRPNSLSGQVADRVETPTRPPPLLRSRGLARAGGPGDQGRARSPFIMSTRHALICAPALPKFDREGGSRRLFDHAILLQELGWTVSSMIQEAEAGARDVRALQQRGIATYVGFNIRMERLIEAICPELAILASWNVA